MRPIAEAIAIVEEQLTKESASFKLFSNKKSLKKLLELLQEFEKVKYRPTNETDLRREQIVAKIDKLFKKMKIDKQTEIQTIIAENLQYYSKEMVYSYWTPAGSNPFPPGIAILANNPLDETRQQVLKYPVDFEQKAIANLGYLYHTKT